MGDHKLLCPAHYVISKFISSVDRLFSALCGLCVGNPNFLEFPTCSILERERNHELFLYYTLIRLADILLIYTDFFFLNISDELKDDMCEPCHILIMHRFNVGYHGLFPNALS